MAAQTGLVRAHAMGTLRGTMYRHARTGDAPKRPLKDNKEHLDYKNHKEHLDHKEHKDMEHPFLMIRSLQIGPVRAPTGLARMPGEVALAILGQCTTATLLIIRRCSVRIGAASNQVLRMRMRIASADASVAAKGLSDFHETLVLQRRPLLDHYRSYLATPATAEVAECAWYSAPSRPVHAICECLCILFGAIPPNRASDGQAPWPILKRIMGRYVFRSWISTLHDNIDAIDIVNVRRVYDLIRADDALTYERVRDVSVVGYRLLIVIAAVLQYARIANDIVVSRKEVDAFMIRSKRIAKFLDAVSQSC